jgi:CBS domain containing-hemolysin-like protein
MLSILYPIAQGFYTITNIIMKLIPFRKEKIFDSEEELKILAELGEEEGTLQEEESEMIQSIFDFTEKTVGEIITPRVDIVGLKSSETLDKAMDVIGEKQFSKIPIFKDNMDNIIGILYAKDIIPYLIGSRPKINLHTISREPFFVPETKPIDELLNEFKLRKTSIAIVVDEWGGTQGLVTLEDVVEEVLGEIRDPYDKEEVDVLKQEDGSFIVEGSITIYDLEEETDIKFPEERDYDTLAGFILDILTDIPKKGECIEYDNIAFTVKTVENNRIGKVKIVKGK